jgi:hypothetical protein
MQQLLEKFKDIIKESNIEKYEVSGNNIKLRMKLLLVDDSQLSKCQCFKISLPIR